jgi:ubiquinone/menaquinone biosynthesis C-methylase UbiE
MKKTQYSKIADRYERNTYRHQIERDHFLSQLMEQIDQQSQRSHEKQREHKPIRVLDIGCGTGLYLAKQIECFKELKIEWHGLEANEAMLSKAMEKNLPVKLHQGMAEYLPYEDSIFDYIVSTYAFHHFTDKELTIKEMKRVLAPGGLIRIFNMAPEKMTKWWIYHYFPQSFVIDSQRFWPLEKLYDVCAEDNYKVRIKLEIEMRQLPVQEIWQHALNRDISLLTF